MAHRTRDHQYFAEPRQRGRHLDAPVQVAASSGDTLTATLELRLRPSRGLAAAVAGLHAATLTLPWLGSLSPAVAVGLSVLVMGHCIFAIRRTVLATPKSVVAVDLEGSACRAHRRDGSMAEGRIAESTIVTGSLVVLVLECGARRTAARVPIVSGMVEAEAFRALRVRLLAHRPGGSSTATAF